MSDRPPQNLLIMLHHLKKDRMVKAKSPVIRCAHPEKISISEAATYTPAGMCSATEVRLEAVGYGPGIIGAIGECSECGKIYYKLAGRE